MSFKIHHIGQFVDDHQATIDFYRDVCGGVVGETVSVDGRIDVTFITFSDHRVELISRTERGTELDGLIDYLLAESAYHVAYVVPDLIEAVEQFERYGISRYDDEPVSGIGAYNRMYVDPHEVPGIPIELVELTE